MDDKLIVIVDDDPEIIKLMGLGLEQEGYKVKGFSCAKDLFTFLAGEKPDLILLDIMLPGVNGLEICKTLKEKERFSSIPVIMLSGRNMEMDKVSGLDAGSDDYIVKPCSINEIKARVRAVLRRRGVDSGEKKVYTRGMITIDPGRHEVTVEGKIVKLTSAEFKILECLSSRKGHVFNRNRILEFLWGEEKIVTERTIDVHIRHLRKKLGKAGKFIINVRDVGYKLEDDI